MATWLNPLVNMARASRVRSCSGMAPDDADLAAARDLIAFIDASPSPFHACATAAARLGTAGFIEVDEKQPWPTDVGRGYVVRDGSLVAWAVGDDGPATPVRIIGAHTDSPNLRVKPKPDT